MGHSQPPSPEVPASSVHRRSGDLSLLLHAREIRHPKSRKHIKRLLIHLNVVNLESRLIWHEVHAPLTLLLLELERDAPHGPALDPAHEMGGEPGDLVPKPLRGDDGDLLEDLLIGVEVEGHARVVALDHLARGFLHGLRADATHG
jgi:hypothetical protein